VQAFCGFSEIKPKFTKMLVNNSLYFDKTDIRKLYFAFSICFHHRQSQMLYSPYRWKFKGDSIQTRSLMEIVAGDQGDKVDSAA
jgi:hypothetical protein